jgi:hypothetical protein
MIPVAFASEKGKTAWRTVANGQVFQGKYRAMPAINWPVNEA